MVVSCAERVALTDLTMWRNKHSSCSMGFERATDVALLSGVCRGFTRTAPGDSE
jgi:hypothetical protein